MNDKILLYWLIAVVICIVIVVIAIFLIKFFSMNAEERKLALKTYLKGLVALAEQEIVGTKRGQEKLEMVQEYFQKKAPMVYKITLLLLGKDNLTQLIEDALKEIKESFGG